MASLCPQRIETKQINKQARSPTPTLKRKVGVAANPTLSPDQDAIPEITADRPEAGFVVNNLLLLLISSSIAGGLCLGFMTRHSEGKYDCRFLKTA